MEVRSSSACEHWDPNAIEAWSVNENARALIFPLMARSKCSIRGRYIECKTATPQFGRNFLANARPADQHLGHRAPKAPVWMSSSAAQRAERLVGLGGSAAFAEGAATGTTGWPGRRPMRGGIERHLLARTWGGGGGAPPPGGF